MWEPRRPERVQGFGQLDVNRQTVDIGPDDAALVREAQRGSTEAFAGLVARYQDRVYNTCYRLCSNEADALDLTQTTFLKALEALPHFELRASLYTWLFRIAVNLAFSERRQRQRRRPVPLDELHEQAAAAERNDASRPLDAQETRERVAAALARLEPEFRVAVVLKDIEGLDYATIAEILEVPIGTVKSRIYRGRTMLREMLSDEETRLGSRQA